MIKKSVNNTKGKKKTTIPAPYPTDRVIVYPNYLKVDVGLLQGANEYKFAVIKYAVENVSPKGSLGYSKEKSIERMINRELGEKYAETGKDKDLAKNLGIAIDELIRDRFAIIFRGKLHFHTVALFPQAEPTNRTEFKVVQKMWLTYAETGDDIVFHGVPHFSHKYLIDGYPENLKGEDGW